MDGGQGKTHSVQFRKQICRPAGLDIVPTAEPAEAQRPDIKYLLIYRAGAFHGGGQYNLLPQSIEDILLPIVPSSQCEFSDPYTFAIGS